MINDVLSWEKFYSVSKKRRSYPPKNPKPFNRLVAYTNNFFAISGIGAFTKGYILVITRELLSSYALVHEKHHNELNWFIQTISEATEKAYSRKVAIFEHGMCACIGGLDRAHLHLLNVNEKVSKKDVILSINNTLIKRRAGINYIQYKKYKFENVHDINEIMNSPKKNSYKIYGKQLNYNDIKNDLNLSKWPLSALNHVKKGGHYVYFKLPSKSCSFLTNKNFNTQIGREILFDVEIKSNKKLNTLKKDVLKNNQYANLWKWQEFPFNENMIHTMRDLAPFLTEAQNSSTSKLYNFKTFAIKD